MTRKCKKDSTYRTQQTHEKTRSVNRIDWDGWSATYLHAHLIARLAAIHRWNPEE